MFFFPQVGDPNDIEKALEAFKNAMGITPEEYATIAPKCECGGKKAGYKDYQVGHARYCPVAPVT